MKITEFRFQSLGLQSSVALMSFGEFSTSYEAVSGNTTNTSWQTDRKRLFFVCVIDPLFSFFLSMTKSEYFYSDNCNVLCFWPNCFCANKWCVFFALFLQQMLTLDKIFATISQFSPWFYILLHQEVVFSSRGSAQFLVHGLNVNSLENTSRKKTAKRKMLGNCKSSVCYLTVQFFNPNQVKSSPTYKFYSQLYLALASPPNAVMPK